MLTAKVSRKPSTGNSATGTVGPVIPALQTSTSMPPSPSTVVAAAFSTAGQSVMSSGTAIPPTAAAVASAAAPSRSQIATWAPSAVNRSATARPIPDAPPVTTARRPAKRPSDTLPTPCLPVTSHELISRGREPSQRHAATSGKKRHNGHQEVLFRNINCSRQALQRSRGMTRIPVPIGVWSRLRPMQRCYGPGFGAVATVGRVHHDGQLAQRQHGPLPNASPIGSRPRRATLVAVSPRPAEGGERGRPRHGPESRRRELRIVC